jgi:hypothetical protein
VTGPSLLVRRLSPIVVAALTTAICVTVAAVAGAPGGSVQVNDPNDTRGLLDVRLVSIDPDADPPQWTVVTFGRWIPAHTEDRAFTFVYLDTKEGAGPDYYVMIRSTGHTLDGSLWRDVEQAGGIRLGPVSVSKGSDDQGVTIEVPLRRLRFGAARTFYRWWVVTTFTGRVCRLTCIDRVPDQGVVEQPLGTGTPTPTTSPPSAASP